MVRICSVNGDTKLYVKFLLGSLKGRDHLEDLSTDVRMILRLILKSV
jgi:hypothetical protein